MKITSVKTFVVGNQSRGGGSNWVFLKLITDAGLEGVGECNMSSGREHGLAQLIEDLSESFVIEFQISISIIKC